MYYFFIAGKIVSWEGLLCRDTDDDAVELADVLERSTAEDVVIHVDPFEGGSIYSEYQLSAAEIERLAAFIEHFGLAS